MFINATGYYIPEQRIDNDYFFSVNGLTSDWIYQRTGIRTRSKASANESCVTMGLAAVKDAIGKLPYSIEEVDLVISAGYSPADTVGTLAHIAQREFGIKNAKSLYLSSACSSFTNALEVVEGYFGIGKSEKALVICSEHNTEYANEEDPKSGHLWGDAAVAVFLSKTPQRETEPEILDVFTKGLGHIGKGPQGVSLRPKYEGISMPYGTDVFVHACKYMCESLEEITKRNTMTIDQLSYIICHQANLRIVANIEERLKLPKERFLNNIEDLGNTGSASAMLVLCQNWEKMQHGNTVGVTVFGGGYSSGGFLVRF